MRSRLHNNLIPYFAVCLYCSLNTFINVLTHDMTFPPYIMAFFILYILGDGSCPGGWSPIFYGTCLRFFTQAETWNSAKASCQAHRAELVTLENSFKIIFFKGWLASIGE